MSTPIWLPCSSLETVLPIDRVRQFAIGDHHVVLQFSQAGRIDKAPIIAAFKAALPDHSVFDSGGDRAHDWITVMPVIARAVVFAHEAEFRAAMVQYLEACDALLKLHAAGDLGIEWRTDLHGEHCRFENTFTGQIVEAPLDGAPVPEKTDAYFFAIFVCTSPGLAAVAALLKEKFHDGARVIDLFSGGRDEVRQVRDLLPVRILPAPAR